MLNTRAAVTAEVHATAIVDESAELGVDVVVGPYAVIGPNVRIGDGAYVGPHAMILRDTILGSGCQVHAGAALGGDPQDLKYQGEPSMLLVGDRTTIREYATLNRGTAARGRTEVGSDCLIMAYAHVAHDCHIGNGVVLANAVNMGGHVLIEDYATVGGIVAIHQFCRIGCHAFIGGTAAVRKDVPPYTKASGDPLHLYGLNSVGLQRRGFPEDLRLALKRAYRRVFQSNLNVSQGVAAVRADSQLPAEVERFLRFIEESERGVTT